MRVLCALLVVPMAACSGNFQVLDAKQKLPGIPFFETQTFVRSGIYTKHSKLQSCVPTFFEETIALPGGEPRYLSIDGAALAKSSMTVKFNDRGVLTEFTFNSEPIGSESAGAAVSALTSLLPFVGVTPEVAENTDSDAAPAIAASGPACNTGPDPDSIKYEAWVPE